jgi:hypothetical protein
MSTYGYYTYYIQKNNIYMHTVPVNPKFYEVFDQLNKKW